MSPTSVSLPPGLGDLLRALRAAGLAVDAREVTRLRTAFELAPRLDQDRGADVQLRRLLTAALVHAPEEGEVFDEVYETWAESWAGWERSARRVEEPAQPAEPPSAPRGRDWRTALVYGRLSLIALAALVLWPPRLPELVPPTPSFFPPPPPELAPPPPPLRPPYVPPPKIEVLTVDRGHKLALHFLPFPLILGGSLALLTAALWERQRRRPPMPEPLPPPPLPGPDRLPPLPLAASGPELLDAEAARTLVWGVGRHFTEDFRPELDLEATARRTAEKAGVPVLCFERESRLREVWLWVDGTVENPALEAYAEEIASSLAESGLPARIGGFEGYPLELAWDEGQRFRPLELEAHRQTALVAVLTDGAVLLRHLEDERQGPVRSLLRGLAAWPRLAFVDFSAGKPELRAVLERHGLARVEPEALPIFFGLGSARAPLARPTEGGDLELWCAALALSPRPVERSEAHLLRRELGLDVSPWALDAAADAVAGARLGFTPERRRDLLVWLTDVEVDEGVRPGGVLDRALAFWERRLEEEEDERRQPGREEHWLGRPAERGLELDRALLRLWRDPSGAAEELAKLRGPATEARLCSELAGMAPRDGWHEGLVRLPWLFRRQPDRTRYLLAELGLGAVGQGSLRRSGRFGASLGALLGLAVGAVLAGLFKLEDVPVDMQFVRIGPGKFTMGDGSGRDSEKPPHEVTLTAGFWMAQHEVTKAEYEHRAPRNDDDRRPQTGVTWDDARSFCQSLGAFNEFDLPTEAQWEYTARASTTTRWSFGDDEARIGEYAWYAGNSEFGIHEVATLEPNRWGLYDMHGNVWEWVLDCWDENAYKKRASTEVRDPLEGLGDCASGFRVLRGGAYWNLPGFLRSAFRDGFRPGRRDEDVGFRCVRSPRRQP